MVKYLKSYQGPPLASDLTPNHIAIAIKTNALVKDSPSF